MAPSHKPLPTEAAEQPVLSPRPLLSWQAGALVLLVALLFATSFLHLRDPRSERADDYAALYVDTMTESRRIYFAERDPYGARVSPTRKAALIADMRRLVDLEPNARAVRRLAIMQYALGDPQWKASLLKLYDLHATGAPTDTERELAMWRAVLEGPIPPDRARGYRDRIVALGLGWYAHLALEALYRNAGMPANARHESETAQDSTARLFLFAEAQVLIGTLGLYLGVRGLLRLWSLRRGARQDAVRTLGPLRSALSLLTSRQADVLYILFLVYLGLYALFRLLVSTLVPVFAGHLSMRAAAQIALAANLVLALATFAALYALFRKIGRRAELTLADIGLRSTNLGQDILWGLGGYAVAVPLLSVANLLSAWLFRGVRSPAHPILSDIAGSHGLFYTLLLFAQVAILPPIMEETMFRGVLFRALSPRLGIYAAIGITSGIFAILHPQLPLGFLGIFVLGVLFNVLYLVRGSLVPGIVAHAINNGTIFILFKLLTAS